MADIASLGIKVTTTGAKEAAADLGKLDTASQKVEKSSQSAAKAMAANAKSAKELQFATRGLPAQFTDIATALGSGQRPLQVLLQQGGQIKDMFGGIGPAVRAMGGYVLGLVNPVTLAAGAFGALAIAWKQGADEAHAFNRALILTGNYAGITAEKLQAMSAQLADSNVTQGRAAETLAQVAATGKFTAEQLGLVTEAALQMQVATGQAVEDTVKQFASLADDPVRAVVKLNDQYHFLTVSVYDQIKALEAQGRTQDAATLAIQTFGRVSAERAKQAAADADWITKSWMGVKSAIAGAFDTLRNFGRLQSEVGRANYNINGAREQLLGLEKRLRAAAEDGTATSGMVRAAQARIKQLQELIAKEQKVLAGDPRTAQAAKDASRQRANEAAIALSEEADAYRTAEEKRVARIAKAHADANEAVRLALSVGDEALAKTIRENEARLVKSLEASAPKGPKPRKPRKERDNSRGIENASDRFDDMVGSLRAELEGPLERAEQQHLKRVREIQQAARDGKRSHEDLTAALALEGEAYAKTADEIKHRFEAEVASLTGPVAQAEERHEAALRRIEELRALGQLSAKQYADALNEEAKAFREDAAAAERAADPIGALLSDMRDELDVIGKSNAERAVMIELRRQNIDAMSAEGQAAIEAAKTFEKEAEAKQRSIDLMDEFRSGASNALTDIVTGAKSAKEAFADFFDDLARRITQMIAERWIEKAFGAQGSDGSGTSGGGWIAAIAGLFANANGNAFQNGQVMAFANGGVFDKPTMFGMGGGRLGVMGEAGPEAILPLHRGPDGKLGVRMAANDGGPIGPAVVHQTVVVQGVMDSRTPDQLAQATARAQNRASSRNR